MKRLQIALEFMIIFSFMLVMFLFLFSLIASQRAQILNSQIFSQEQMIGQSVSVQVDRALQAGNGYSATVPVTGSIGTLSYNLTITRNGAIIVNASVAQQSIQAITYSSAKSVVSNPSYLQHNTQYYNLPIGNGTISIQNSYGTICIDYQCPVASNLASNLTITAQVVHAATFGTYSSCPGPNYVPIVINSIGQSTLGSVTMSWWAYPVTPSVFIHLNSGNPSGSGNGSGLWCLSNECAIPNLFVLPPFTAQNNAWAFYTLTLSSSTATYYINGVPGTPVTWNGPLTSVVDLDLLGYEPGCSDWTQGSMANAQIYSASLSSAQVQQLYQEGIAGLPFSSNLVGWWPLNGNAKDYSGGGNNGVATTQLLYTGASELFAKVINQAGQAVANDLVGFTTTLGNFTGTATSATGYTNANGIATAFLTQQLNNGQATVEATAYNGNTYLAANLVGWWPLGNGQGSLASDLSGNGNNGMMQGYASWSVPNYVAGFDGKTSSIQALSSPELTPTSAFTVSAWIYDSNPNSYTLYVSKIDASLSNGYYLYTDARASSTGTLQFVYYNGGTRYATGANFVPNTWLFVTGVYDGSFMYIYVNGVSHPRWRRRSRRAPTRRLSA